MNLNYRGISRVIAAFLIIQGIMMLPPFFVGILYNEKYMPVIFIALAGLDMIAGLIMAVSITPPETKKFRIRDGFIVVLSCWLLACTIGAVPFMMSGFFDTFAKALFEAVSGFTTTGSSVLTDIEALPRSLLFWRCQTHWMGGFGIVFVPIALLPVLGMEGQPIARAELSGLSLSKIAPKLSDTGRSLLAIFAGLTAIQTILLLLGGMSLFDAVTHAFSTMGTGGFSNYNNSVAHFDSYYIYWVISIFMLLAGINFNLYYIAIQHGVKEAFADSELQFYLFISGAAISLITIHTMITGCFDNFGDAITQSVFQVASIITTTGFATMDYDVSWGLFPKMILLILMIVGGCSSSTAGGIKSIRALIVLKMIRRGLLVRLHPNAIIDIKANNRKLPTEALQAIAGFVFLYVLLLCGGFLLVSTGGFDATTCFSAVIASAGSIGPGFNLVGPAMNYSIFPDYIHYILCFLMLAGRLELMTVIVVLTPHFWNPDH